MQQTIGGVRMHWREAGEGDAVMFIHGFPFNSAMWAPQIAAVPAGWRFIAPDLRGFGETEAAGTGPLTMDLLADDIVALMDHLAIEQSVVCGLSMGGYVALSLATRHPDRVRALALVATRANADSEEARANRHKLAAAARQQGTQPVIESMLPKLVSAHTRMKHDSVVAHVRAMMEATAPETMARALEGMAERKNYVADLANINVSTLIVRGEQDEIIPAGDMELIARSVRGARHELVALSGHLPNLEASDVFNSIFFKFLGFLPPMMKLGDFSLSF